MTLSDLSKSWKYVYYLQNECDGCNQRECATDIAWPGGYQQPGSNISTVAASADHRWDICMDGVIHYLPTGNLHLNLRIFEGTHIEYFNSGAILRYLLLSNLLVYTVQA